MGRAIGAIVAGFVLWTVLWLGMNAIAAVALPEIIVPGEPLTHTGLLVAFILYGVVISVVAGYVCATVKREDPAKTVMVFGLILLAVGIFVEVMSWGLLPIWYHLVFLALLEPAAVYGGRKRVQGRA
jgi:hypothetical protein